MQTNEPNQEIVQELYRALMLSSAESGILGTVPAGSLLTSPR
jgi:hypothetical protein